MILLSAALIVLLGCSLLVYAGRRRTDRRIADYEQRMERANEAYQAAVRATVDRAMGAVLDASHGIVNEPDWFDANLAEAVAVTGHAAVKAGPGSACWTFERGRC